MREIKKIIIHCSVTPEGKHFTVDDIRRWHTLPVAKGGRGWSDIGYHYVIYLDGSVHTGRPVEKIGAHCKGQNAGSIGICYIGGLAAGSKIPKDTRTAAQKSALRLLVDSLKGKYPGATVHGHNEFAAKACPCFNVKKEFQPNNLTT